MDVVPSTALLKMGYDEINKSRDYIADRTSAVTPIAKGGTGATTASAARTNLGLASTVAAVAAANTGGSEGVLILGGAGGRINVGAPNTPGNAATKGYVDDTAGNRVLRSGDTMSGSLNINAGLAVTGAVFNSGAAAATSGYVVAYINGDGRLSRGTSSRRWKKYIRPAAALPELAPVLQEFQHKGGDGRWVVGYIAEDWAADPDLERFVMYDDEGLPVAIDYIQFLLARVDQLAAALAAVS
jgi:hypothetical protein